MNGNGDLQTRFLGEGTQSAPSESFFYETNTGIYHDIDTYPNTAWTMVKKGNKRIRVDDTATTLYGTVNVPGLVPAGTISLLDGSASSPSLNFQSSTSSGIYESSNGVSISSVGQSIASFGTSGITTTKSISTPDVYSSGFIVAPNDNVGSPGFTWNSDLKTGMFRKAVNTMGFSSNGSDRLDIGSSSVTSFVPIYAPSGSSSSPSYSFSSSTSTGFSDDDSIPAINTTVSGTKVLSLQNDGVMVMSGTNPTVFTGKILIVNDSLGGPGYAWNSDQGTGFYLSNAGTHEIGMACNFVNAGKLTSTLLNLPGDVNYKRYSLRLVQAVGQVIANSTLTFVSWDTVESTGGGNVNWGTVTLPITQVVIPKSGMYLVRYGAVWSNPGGAGNGFRSHYIEVNSNGTPGASSRYYASTNFPAATATPNFCMTGSDMLYHFNANDTVCLTVNQTSGGNLTFSNQSNNYAVFQFVRLFE